MAETTTARYRPLTSAALQSAAALYQNASSSSFHYWRQAIDARATPLDAMSDLLTWASVTTHRERPSWSTPHRIVAEWPLARLRNFSDHEAPRDHATSERRVEPALQTGAAPILLLPPQAGHDSCIVDFAPHQSQVRTALDAGLTVLSLDWKGATTTTRSASIEDYIALVAQAVNHAGGRVNLTGDCQGGWLAVIYAALFPDTVESLTIAGAPVDFHAGEPLIRDWMQVLSPRGDLGLYRAVVAAHGGVLPGRFLLSGFKAMQPEAGPSRKLALLAAIHDPGQIERHQRFENWFEHTQPVPGAFYLWIVRHLFQRNELVTGQLEVGGRRVDLGRLTMPLHLAGGAADHITPPAQVFALAAHAGTAPSRITQYLAPGGHLGLFMGREALQTVWASIFAAIAAGPASVRA